MDSFIIGMMFILGGFVIIYVIATKFGNYDSDSAEEVLDSVDSEPTLPHVPSEKHNINGMLISEDSVIMKYNTRFGIFFGVVLLITAFVCIFVRVYVEYVLLELGAWILAIYLGAIGIMSLILPFISKTILNNDGITVKFSVRCFSFIILEKTTLMIPWNAISHVKYVSILIRYFTVPSGFHFHYTKPRGKTRPLLGEHYVFFISYTEDNYKKAMEYAIKKLPKDKFMDDAKDKLKSMGIWK